MAGNPTGQKPKPIPGILSIPRGGDYLEQLDRPIVIAQPETNAPVAKPQPIQRDESGENIVELPQPTNAKPKAKLTETENLQPGSQQVEPQEQPSKPARKKKKKKASSKKTSGKKRPKRADIGFRLDLEEATSKLRKHVIAQGDEEYVTRTDIVAQATCAVARAMSSINCAQVSRRGHYGSITATAYDAALQEAFYKGTALHYIENNIDKLPDRILQLCYEQYRLRNDLLEEH